MSWRRLRGLSLFWKIFLSTSITTTLLFAATALIVNTFILRETQQSVTQEAQASLRQYQFLWRAKADNLAKISLLMSTMSDVRAAFSTKDPATVRDSAGELWRGLSQGGAIFAVFDPRGEEIASLGGQFTSSNLIRDEIRGVAPRFPHQVAGFVSLGDRLYYLLLTPVYVQTERQQALLNVLVAGFEVDDHLAADLKSATEGSDFVFRSGLKTMASTVSPRAAEARNAEYAIAVSPLKSMDGRQVGELRVMRSLEKSTARLHWLSRIIGFIWIVTLIAGLLLTYLVASRLVAPVKALGLAAAEIGKGNYDYRVSIEQNDELGRLAQTFNIMCDSIQRGRDELISQERLNTVGRLSSSIVHDLRNPLAAIYAGSEMLVDIEDLGEESTRRLASSIYRASQRIQQLLEDLSQSVNRNSDQTELCGLKDVVESAYDVIAPNVVSQGVRVSVEIASDIEVMVHRSRMERVFLNLMSNSVEAMPKGGDLHICAHSQEGTVVVEIDDTGVGLSDEVRKQVFRPFFSSGKRNGLGLGLALSRQTVLDHGGNLWASHKSVAGARFCIQLPVSPSESNQKKIAHNANL